MSKDGLTLVVNPYSQKKPERKMNPANVHPALRTALAGAGMALVTAGFTKALMSSLAPKIGLGWTATIQGAVGVAGGAAIDHFFDMPRAGAAFAGANALLAAQTAMMRAEVAFRGGSAVGSGSQAGQMGAGGVPADLMQRALAAGLSEDEVRRLAGQMGVPAETLRGGLTPEQVQQLMSGEAARRGPGVLGNQPATGVRGAGCVQPPRK